MRRLLQKIAATKDTNYGTRINALADEIAGAVESRMRGLIKSKVVSPVTGALVSSAVGNVVSGVVDSLMNPLQLRMERYMQGPSLGGSIMLGAGGRNISGVAGGDSYSEEKYDASEKGKDKSSKNDQQELARRKELAFQMALADHLEAERSEQEVLQAISSASSGSSGSSNKPRGAGRADNLDAAKDAWPKDSGAFIGESQAKLLPDGTMPLFNAQQKYAESIQSFGSIEPFTQDDLRNTHLYLR